jgi:hypothetical protein
MCYTKSKRELLVSFAKRSEIFLYVLKVDWGSSLIFGDALYSGLYGN